MMLMPVPLVSHVHVAVEYGQSCNTQEARAVIVKVPMVVYDCILSLIAMVHLYYSCFTFNQNQSSRLVTTLYTGCDKVAITWN